ncbi:chemotaxis protein CheW [Chryseolinea lacunae]|uniref:Chemotaxis protein CheW n=1 Tax=Chryseolinea lacunae TaxID=2801331 RepID=A0ABS1KYN4_9BACT|nr:chemotaxis protein CheW [Chryseolinea lacunae]MBL0744558.1 chemotaxis protein CheW [Chryseolinea lacunae]
MKNDSNAYLTFALGSEKFAIKVDHVQEVVEFGQFTKVPHAPAYMLGIINLRGRVLPLLDTKLKLGLQATERTQKSRIMVLDIQMSDEKSLQIGAMVDIAREVVEISDSEIQEAPEFENLKTDAPITGIVNQQGDITMIMDIAKVFSVNDIVELNRSLN